MTTEVRRHRELNRAMAAIPGPEEADALSTEGPDDSADLEGGAKARGRPPSKVRLTPAQVDYLWDKFLKEHGHLDANGEAIYTERLQQEVGIEAGLKPLFAQARYGDIRAAEVILRVCLPRARQPIEVQVALMDKRQIKSRVQTIMETLEAAGIPREQIEAASMAALPPAIEGELKAGVRGQGTGDRE
jgi:hypothetical protein